MEKLYVDVGSNEWEVGYVIVMWDGKWWGTYYNFEGAVKDCDERLKDTEKGFTYEDDIFAFEFLEIIDAPPFNVIHAFERTNERGERVSFGHTVKVLDNPLIQEKS